MIDEPALLIARLDEPLSRWLWLVKWLLALPHVAILVFLWPVFIVLTVAAWCAILFTGRYPARVFDVNVGILRWTWRVGFYAYSVIGTDRYPPFSFDDVDYPARLTVRRPLHLSRGLALVKWLLALPHYLIVAAFSATAQSCGGLLPLLSLFAGLALLFTGRYPRGIFDLELGLHRWAFRTFTYVMLMHDVYPPFRLDLGGGVEADGR